MKKHLLIIASLSVMLCSDSFASDQERDTESKPSLSSLIDLSREELNLTRQQNARYTELQEQITDVQASLNTLKEDDALSGMRAQVQAALPQPFNYEDQSFGNLNLQQKMEQLSGFLAVLETARNQLGSLIDLRQQQRNEEEGARSSVVSPTATPTPDEISSLQDSEEELEDAENSASQTAPVQPEVGVNNPVLQSVPVQTERSEARQRVFVNKDRTERVCTGTDKVISKLKKKTQHHLVDIILQDIFEQNPDGTLTKTGELFKSKSAFNNHNACLAAQCSTIPAHLRQYF